VSSFRFQRRGGGKKRPGLNAKPKAADDGSLRRFEKRKKLCRTSLRKRLDNQNRKELKGGVRKEESVGGKEEGRISREKRRGLITGSRANI